MKAKLITAPTIEPVTLAELKLHLRLDSGSFADNIDEVQSLAPGSKAIADNFTTHVGTGVEVLGYTAVLELISGTNGATGTVQIKIQESDTDVSANYTDWSGTFEEIMTLDVAPGVAWAVGDTITGATSGKTCVITKIISTTKYVVKDRSGTFTLHEVLSNGTSIADQGAANPTFFTLTTDNDNATYEKAYTGTKRYVRTVAKVLLAACEFGTTVIRLKGPSIEDDWLNDTIAEARQYVEDITRRKILTQTWEYYLDEWPSVNYIKLPFGNLQSNAKATGTVTSSGVNVTHLDTITIGTKTYRFVNVPTIEGDIDIGATAAITLDNLKAAINHTGTPGVQYLCANAHPTVEATTNTDTVQTLESIIGGVDGNLIALTTTAVTYTLSGVMLTGGVTSGEIKYFDSDGLAMTMVITTDYEMEFNGEGCGRIVLPYGGSWPSITLFPSNPIVIKFTCGWTTAALVSRNLKAMIKLYCADKYEHRGEGTTGQTFVEDKSFYRLRMLETLWDEF